MPKFKNLLKSTIIKPAGKQRECHHNRKQHIISKGEWVLEVDDQGFCSSCALKMIRAAKSEIIAMESKFR